MYDKMFQDCFDIFNPIGPHKCGTFCTCSCDVIFQLLIGLFHITFVCNQGVMLELRKYKPFAVLFHRIVELYYSSIKLKVKHWRIQGGAPPAPPPTGSNSFVFTYVFAEKHTCRRSAPPQQVGAPPQRKILDPPL